MEHYHFFKGMFHGAVVVSCVVTVFRGIDWKDKDFGRFANTVYVVTFLLFLVQYLLRH